MNTALEVTLFIIAVVGVIALGIWKSKDGEDDGEEKGAANYFLAGRGLTWWLVGFSLIAANISTEQFVGMSGQSADWLGMAIASYEWMAAVTLVFVAFWFLPKFLKAGIYTIPEFLQYRFDGTARMVMALFTIITLVFVTTASVIYSGAKFVSEYYNDVPIINNLTVMCWAIAILAAVYVFIGGLKACAWTDLIWGSALILGGAVVMWFAFQTLENTPADQLILTKVANSEATIKDLEGASALDRLLLLNDGKDGEAAARNGNNLSGGKMHMVRPKEDTDIPWTALLIGLWIPNFFYWGLNQYIVQRTLGSKSLAEGQKGIVFAAGLKLIIPFLVVIPGILAFNLFSNDLHQSALKANESGLAKIEAHQVVKVDQDFVKLQPDQLPKIFDINTKHAGMTVVEANEKLTENFKKNNPDVKEIPTPTPAETINFLADSAEDSSDGKVSVGPSLSGYDYDAAFPVLVRNLVKPHPYISWFVLAALCGAVISSLASMLNSASTIATMDFYAKFKKSTESHQLVRVGRIFVIIFVILAAIIAPKLDDFKSIFKYIQEFQGFLSPGILAVFIFGFFSPRTPRWFGVVGIVTNIIAYGALKWGLGSWIAGHGFWYAQEMAFLDRMAICFILVLVIGILITLFKPMTQPVVLPENTEIELESSKGAKVVGVCIVVATIALYAVFW